MMKSDSTVNTNIQPRRDSRSDPAMLQLSQVEFALGDGFLNKFRDKQPNWGPLGYITYKRTYARELYDEHRTEEYWETLKRVVEGTFKIQKWHCKRNRYRWNERKAVYSAQIMYQKMWEFKLLPPGRGLWMMGTDFIWKHGSMALNNCGFVSTEDIRIQGSKPFRWMMDNLMLGVGIGFDVMGGWDDSDELFATLPRAKQEEYIILQNPQHLDATWVITDDREGWVRSIGYILDAFFFSTEELEDRNDYILTDPEYNGSPIFNGIPKFDYSKIRPKGAAIKGFGGKASGPEPLITLHKNLIKMLSSRIGKPLNTVDIVDIGNNIGGCVIAGNVRRSAEIALGKPTDKRYIRMKSRDELARVKDTERDFRWSSNNSAIASIGCDYTEIAENIVNNGEPGLVWLDNARAYRRMREDEKDYSDPNAKGVNPCCEQTLESYEVCNLVETMPSKHTGGIFMRLNKKTGLIEEKTMTAVEEYHETLKYAYLYAKTVTLLNTHWEETNNVMQKNKRIGVSMTGIPDAFAKFGRDFFLKEFCDKGYQFLRKLDAKWSKEWLVCMQSNKLTTVKPSGTTSLLAGVSPGIHYPHSEYYIRRIRIAADSELLDELRACGYTITPDPYGAIYQKDPDTYHDLVIDGEKIIIGYTTMVVDFPVHEKYYVKSKFDASMWEQGQNVFDMQYYWADNQVSATITFTKEEARDVKTFLEIAQNKCKGISMMPLENHGYALAPYEAITKEEFERLSSQITPPNFNRVTTAGVGERFCTNATCDHPIEKCDAPLPSNIPIANTANAFILKFQLPKKE